MNDQTKPSDNVTVDTSTEHDQPLTMVRSEQDNREAAKLLLSLIPDKSRDSELISSSIQAQLIEDIYRVVVANQESNEQLIRFGQLMIRQVELIREVQTRSRMLVGV